MDSFFDKMFGTKGGRVYMSVDPAEKVRDYKEIWIEVTLTHMGMLQMLRFPRDLWSRIEERLSREAGCPPYGKRQMPMGFGLMDGMRIRYEWRLAYEEQEEERAHPEPRRVGSS